MESVRFAEATNRIVLALSYSYIAAVIFHFIVNYCPHKYRSNKMQPFVDGQLWLIKEYLRQCKNTVLPVFDLSGKTYSKEEYCSLFYQTDFYADYALTKGQSKLARIELLRNKIIDAASQLLTYRDFLTDDQFSYLLVILNSQFIKDSLIPFEEGGNNNGCNQKQISESLFDLYEQSKKLG